MFEILDRLFSQDITNHIMGFNSGQYINQPQYHSRIYKKAVCDLKLPIPKPQFIEAVWDRRYRNPYNPPGIKLRAFDYVNLPTIRVPHIITRSYKRFTHRSEMDCECQHFSAHRAIRHWLNKIFAKIMNTKSHDLKMNGWDISIPFVLITFVRIFPQGDSFRKNEKHWKVMFPHLQWDLAGEKYNTMLNTIPSNTSPLLANIDNDLEHILGG